MRKLRASYRIRCDGCGQLVNKVFLRVWRWGHFGGWRDYRRFCLECTTIKIAWLDDPLTLPWDDQCGEVNDAHD